MVRPTRSDVEATFRTTRGDRRGPLLPGSSPAAAVRTRVLAIASQIDDPATRMAFDELVSSLHGVFSDMERRIGQLDQAAGGYEKRVQSMSSDPTIESGLVTLPKSPGPAIYSIGVDTESGASSDDLGTVSGGREGDMLVIRAVHDDHSIVLKNGAGTSPQLFNDASSDVTLNETGDTALFYRASDDWLMLQSSNNSVPTSTATHLTTVADFVDRTSYTSSSIAPTANRLVLCWVTSLKTDAPSAPTLSGNGMTWVEVASVLYDDFGSPKARLTLFRAMDSSPSSGVVTISFGAATQAACAWSISEFANVDTSGSNGAGAVVQADTNSANSTSVTVALAGFGDTKNRPAFGVAHQQSSNDFTPKSGFTELGEDDASGAHIMSAFKGDGVDTNPSGSVSSSTRLGIIAVEIKQGG